MIDDEFYYLFSAFDRLGKRLYGSAWTGREIIDSAVKAPKEIETTREQIAIPLREIELAIRDHETEISKEVKADKIETHQTSIKNLREEQATLRVHLNNLPDLNDNYHDRYESYERRRITEETLIAALVQGDLQGQPPGGLIIPQEFWSGRRGFQYYLSESLAVMPRDYYGKRRGTVLIKKIDFDSWLQGVAPIRAEDRIELSPEEQCRIRLLQLSATTSRRPKKDECREEATREIEGLSRRAFDRVWGEVAPKSWTLRGRRRGT